MHILLYDNAAQYSTMRCFKSNIRDFARIAPSRIFDIFTHPGFIHCNLIICAVDETRKLSPDYNIVISYASIHIELRHMEMETQAIVAATPHPNERDRETHDQLNPRQWHVIGYRRTFPNVGSYPPSSFIGVSVDRCRCAVRQVRFKIARHSSDASKRDPLPGPLLSSAPPHSTRY
jgi:hypothetical protein